MQTEAQRRNPLRVFPGLVLILALAALWLIVRYPAGLQPLPDPGATRQNPPAPETPNP